MSTAALVSVEEYLQRTEKPNCEYIDGVLYPKATATILHAWIQRVLLRLLERQGAQAFPELTLRLSPTKYLVPDFCVVRQIELQYPTEPVLLCAEILSPEDRLSAVLAKCKRYHAWGVPYCWVIDPEKRIGLEYHANGEPNRVADTLRAGEIAASLSELFAQLPPAAK